MLFVGTGYALWSENLYINGTINTGSLGAKMVLIDTYDNELTIENNTKKDVSNVTAVVSEDGSTMNVTVNNAYPCITYTVVFNVTNTGSIPLKIFVSSSNVPCCVTVTIDPNINYQNEIQLHPGESLQFTLTIHLSNSCSENAQYSFALTLFYHQWNEAPPQ